MKYMLICPSCQNKTFTNGDDLEKNFHISTNAPVPKRGDGKNKETIEQKKKIKCDKCGFLFKIVKLTQEPIIEKEEPERELPKTLKYELEDYKKDKKKK
jgi:hypothetical protein